MMYHFQCCVTQKKQGQRYTANNNNDISPFTAATQLKQGQKYIAYNNNDRPPFSVVTQRLTYTFFLRMRSFKGKCSTNHSPSCALCQCADQTAHTSSTLQARDQSTVAS